MNINPAIFARGLVLAGPTADGTAGQVLQTNADGTTSWTDADGHAPAAHAASHAAAGSDPVTLSQSQITGLVAALAACQPLDSDLTAIAALTTTSYGRGLLTLASATALAAEVDPFFLTPAEGAAAFQPLDSDLSAIAALATTSFGRALLTLANAAALAAAAGLGNVENTALSTWAGSTNLNTLGTALSIKNGATTVAFFDTTGFLGIGTISPAGVIDLKETLGTTLVSPVNMTTNSAPSPYVAAASTEINGSNQAFMAFDGSDSTKWLANTSTGTLSIDLGSGNAVAAVNYRITGLVSGQETRSPKSWTLQGSNDNTNWTTLDTQTNVAAWSAVEVRSYNFTNATAYRYYRLNITANQGDSLVGVVALRVFSAASNQAVKFHDGVMTVGLGAHDNSFTLVTSDGVLRGYPISNIFKLTTPGNTLTLEQTGAGGGSTRFHLKNTSGANGAIFENAGLDLVDFGFLPSSGVQSNFRLEHRTAQLIDSANATGEFQLFIDSLGTPVTAAAWGANLAVINPRMKHNKVAYSPETALTDGATINWNLDSAPEAKVTLGGNRAVAAATNQVAGAKYAIRVIQDGTGARTLTWDSTYVFPSGAAPILNRSASASDTLNFRSDGTNMHYIGGVAPTESLMFAVGDETTAITTGTGKLTFRMPYKFQLSEVRANLNTVSSSGLPEFNVKEGGTTIFSTNLTIDASEKTSTTAATPAVLSDYVLADDAEITVDIVTAGTGAKGPKLTFIGRRVP
jgi:hypothetical protein